MHKIITKAEAKKQGLKTYFTGRPCPRGHIAECFVTGKCVECNRERNKLRPKVGKVKVSKASMEAADRAVSTAIALRDELLQPAEKDWSYYVIQITVAWQKSVSAIIVTGELLIEAKAKVGHGDWLKLVEELPFSEDTAQRLMAIARHPVISNTDHVRYLPPSYGTLYELTKVPEQKLLAGIKDHVINPDMERKDVARLLGRRRRLSKQERRIEAHAARLQADWLADHPGKTVEDYKLAGSCQDTEEGEAEYAEWARKRREVLAGLSDGTIGDRCLIAAEAVEVVPPEAEDQETEAAEDPAGFVVAVIKNATEKAQIAVRILQDNLTESEKAEIVEAIDALIRKWNAVRRKVEQ
jgi:hypothetical protein